MKRLRLRYLVAVSAVACGGSSSLVNAPLSDGDAGPPPLVKPPTPVATKKVPIADPPEPVRPPWAESEHTRCEEDLDAPDPPDFQPPFETCPKRHNSGQFSAKHTRARRAATPDICCYVEWISRAVPGRALPDKTVAMATPRADWSEDLPPAPGQWLQPAHFEHASIASFARLALDLMAFGAPPDLIEDAHRAALDEIRHARICFALHGGHEGPGPLVTPPGVGSLAELVRETIREGCVNETLAALEARAMAGKMPPHLREVLNAIADDEERHAELAFRIVAWAAMVDPTIALEVPAVDHPAMKAVILPCLRAVAKLRRPRGDGSARARRRRRRGDRAATL